MKKILYIIDKPNLYGSEQHVLKLMITLKKKYEVILLVFDEGPLLAILDNNNISYHLIRMKWYPTLKLLDLNRFIKRNNFDIIHAHQPKALLWASVLAKWNSTPSVITIHSLPSNNIQTYNNYFVKMVVGLFHTSIKYISEFFASKIIYLSNFSFATSAFKAKSLIIPNWLDEVIDDRRIKTNFNEPIQLISVGSVTYNKGMDRMIETLALIKDRDWCLKIVGDYSKEYMQELVDLAVTLSIKERIEFVGYVDNPTELLLSSDGFILLSRGETFGLVYIEAMNCGLPVIAWDIPVIKEILPKHNTVLKQKTDIEDVFKLIYSSQGQFQAISQLNRDFVKEKFSWNKIYFKYINLYDQILYNNRN